VPENVLTIAMGTVSAPLRVFAAASLVGSRKTARSTSATRSATMASVIKPVGNAPATQDISRPIAARKSVQEKVSNVMTRNASVGHQEQSRNVTTSEENASV